MGNYIAEEEKRKAKDRYAQYKKETQQTTPGFDLQGYNKLKESRNNRLSATYDKMSNGQQNIRESVKPAYANVNNQNDQVKGLLHAYGQARLDGSDADTNPTVRKLEGQIKQVSGKSGNELQQLLNDARDVGKNNKSIKSGKGLSSSQQLSNARAKVANLSGEEQDFLMNDYANAYSNAYKGIAEGKSIKDTLTESAMKVATPWLYPVYKTYKAEKEVNDYLNNGEGKISEAKSAIDMFKMKGEAQKRFGWTPEQTEENFGYAQRIRNQEEQDALNAQAAIDENNKVGGSVKNSLNVLAHPLAGMKAMGSMFDTDTQGFDPNSPWARQFNYKKANQEAVANAIGNDTVGQKVGSFVYNAGMSTIESAETMGLASLLPGGKYASLVPFFASASVDKMQDAKARGLTDDQAYAESVLSGMAEAGAELIPLEHLWKLAGKGLKGMGKEFWKGVGKQALEEFGEETITSLANLVSDYFIAHKDKKADIDVKYQNYINSGMSEEDAKREVVKDTVYEIGMDGLGGLFSGGLMGFGGASIGVANTRSYQNSISDAYKDAASKVDESTAYGKATKEQYEKYGANPIKAAADFIDDSSEEGKNIKAELYKLADKIDSGKKLSLNDQVIFANLMDEAKSVKISEDTENYLKENYKNEVLVPEAHRTAATGITINEATKQLAEASKNADADKIDSIYQLMKNSTSAETRSQAESILDSFKGMALHNGVSAEQWDAIKGINASEAYMKGIHGEVIDESKLTNASREGYNAGNKQRIEDHANVIKRVSETKGSDFAKQAYVENSNSSIGLAQYDKAFDTIYNNAVVGNEFSADSKEVALLGEEAAKNIHEAGVKDFEMGVQKEAAEHAVKALVGKVDKKGTGSFTDNRKNAKSDIDTTFMKLIATVTKNDIVLVDAANSDIQASFDPRTSTITVTEDHASQLIHELGEFVEFYASKEYEDVRAAVMATSKQMLGDERFNQILNNYHNTYLKVNKNQTMFESSSEMANDFLVAMMSTNKGQKAFAEYIAKNNSAEEAKTVGEKIKGFFAAIRNAIKSMLASTKLNGYQREVLENEMAANKKNIDLFMKALDKAIKNAQSLDISKKTETTMSDAEHSLVTITEAIGLNLVMEDHMAKFVDENGKEITEFTPSIIENSQLGALLKYNSKNRLSNVSEEDLDKEFKMLSDLFNQMREMQDIDLVWAVNSAMGYQAVADGKYESNKKSKFAAITGNADPQYASTIDFTTICLKTQAIVDAMSGTMKELGRGLTPDEIIKVVYPNTHKAGEPVPCPVCYVFSRWVGLGGLLDRINNLQEKYPPSISEAEIRKVMDDLEVEKKKIQKQIGDTKKPEKVIRAEYDVLAARDFASKNDSKLKLNAKEKERFKVLGQYIDVMDQRAWFDKVRLNKNYKPVPQDVLFDINAGRNFAEKYPLTWKYRTTRGSGMGKATIPYSDLNLGQVVRGIASPSSLSKNIGNLEADPFLFDKNKNRILSNELSTSATRVLENAIKNQKAQNLYNGQRVQSTSDYRYEYGLDYLMGYLELQAIAAKVQMYTKVPESVIMHASVNSEVNCSIMPLGDGYVIDENGNVNLVFSSVTGMHPDDAFRLSQMFDNVQPIMVGINNTHIKACLADDRISFVIPYHSSGNTEGRYIEMMKALEESVVNRTDYTKYQNDVEMKNATPEQKLARDVRMKILTGKYWADKSMQNLAKLSKEEQAVLDSNSILNQLYKRFYVEGVDPECYKVVVKTAPAEKIMPYEFWDTSLTLKDADKNTEIFMQYCESMGIKPRFSGYDSEGRYNAEYDFTKEPGYWKMLPDRRMYNRDGTYHVQKAINVSDFSLDFLSKKAADSTKLIDGTPIRMPSKVNDKTKTKSIVEQSVKDIKMSLEVDSDGNKLTENQSEYFKDSKIRDDNGNLIIVYHGTTEEFTVFDRTKSRANMDIQGNFFSPWEIDAGGYGGNVGAYYLNIKNPASEAMGYKALNKFKGQNEAGRKAREYLESLGYDGVNNSNEEYIAFYPEQIKRIDNLNPTSNPDIRYSIKLDEESGVEYVEVDTDQKRLEGLDESALLKEVRTILKEFLHANNKVLGSIDDTTITGNHDLISHYAGAARVQYKKDSRSEAKFRATTELLNLIKVSVFDNHKTFEDIQKNTPGKHLEAIKGITQYKTLFHVLDNYYVGYLNVLNRKQDRVLYDITKIRKIVKGDIAATMSRVAVTDPSYNEMVTYYQNKSKKFSLDVDSELMDDAFVESLIDDDLDGLFTEEELKLFDKPNWSVSDLMQTLAEEIEKAPDKKRKEAIKHLTRKALGDQFKTDGKRVSFTDERIDSYLDQFASTNNDYAQAYITYMSPADYMLLTANGKNGSQTFDRLMSESHEFNEEEFKDSIKYQPIFLDIDQDNKITRVVGHEGRHRMIALQLAGYTQIPVLLFNYSNKYSKAYIPSMTLRPQDFSGDSNYNKSNYISLSDIEPLSRGNADNVKAKFGSNSNADISYSLDIEEDELALFENNNPTISDKSVLDEGLKALKGKAVNTKAINKIASELKTEFASTIDKKEFADMLTRAFGYLHTRDNITFNDVMALFSEVARPVIDSATKVDNADLYNEFTDYFRGKKIKLSETQMAEVKSVYGSYAEFQKAVYPLQFSTKGDTTLDSMWYSLAEQFPGLVEYDTTEGDMPVAINDLVEALRPSPTNTFGADAEEVGKDLAMRIVESYLSTESDAKIKKLAEKMRASEMDYRKQVRDRYREKYNKAKADLKDTLDARRLAEKQRQMDAKKKADDAVLVEKWKAAEELHKTKDRYEDVIADIRAKSKDRMTTYKDRQNAKKQKKMIAEIVNDLSTRIMNPTEKKHVPHDMIKPLMGLLQTFNFVEPEISYNAKTGMYEATMLDYNEKNADGKNVNHMLLLQGKTRGEVLSQFYAELDDGKGSQNQKRWQERLGAIKDLFDKSAKADTEAADVYNMLDATMADSLADLLQRNDNQLSINNLSTEDLITVKNALKNISKAINEQNKAFTMNQDIDDTAHDIQKNGQKYRKDRSSLFIGGHNVFVMNMMSPDTYFSMLGEKGHGIYKAFQDALDKKIKYIQQSSEYMQNTLDGIDKKIIRSWSGDKAEIHTFNVADGEVKMTTAQIMALYELSKRQQAMGHIMSGGITVERLKVGWKKLNLIQDRGIHITLDELSDIVSTLTPEQMAIADAMQKYMVTESAKQGNEASMKMYGFEKYLDDEYFPITTASDSVNSKNEDGNFKTLNGIERMGFTKAVVKNAGNPIVVRDIFDVFVDHTVNMATYAAYAPVIKDAIRIYNYKDVEDVNGSKYYMTVKQALNACMGRSDDAGREYFDNLIRDINGSERAKTLQTGADAFAGHYKAAAVGGNLRVVAQQPTAYIRAGVVIDPKYLAQATPRVFANVKRMEELKEKVPLIYWKSQGYYETNIGRSERAIITGVDSVSDKVTEASMWLAGKADDITWATIYDAAERQIKAENPGLTGDEFDKKVIDLFNKAIHETQVVDATIMKAPWLRMSDSGLKLMSSFMAEPIKSYNIALKSIIQANRGNIPKKAVAYAVGVLIATDMVNALAQSIVDGLRYHDDDEEYLEEVLNYWLPNFIDNVNPIGRIPFVKDMFEQLVSSVKGENSYGKNGSGQLYEYAAASSLFNAIGTLSKQLKGEYNKTNYSAYMDYARALSQLTGMPIYNISRDASSVWNMFAPSDMDLKKNVEKPTDKYNNIITVLDRDRADEYLDEAVQKALEKNGTVKDIKSKLSSAYKQDYLEALANGDESAEDLYNKAVRGYMAVGLSQVDAEAEVESWTDVTVGYSDLDKAIMNSDGIELATKIVMDNKEKDKILNHIYNSFGATIEYNRMKGYTSDIETNVNKVLNMIDGSNYDQLVRDMEAANAKAEANKAKKEQTSAAKKTVYDVIDNGGNFDQAVQNALNSGMEPADVKSALSDEYKDKVIEMYRSGNTEYIQVVYRIAKCKAKADEVGKPKISARDKNKNLKPYANSDGSINYEKYEIWHMQTEWGLPVTIK